MRWRLKDLAQWVLEEFRIALDETTVGRAVKALGFVKISARPRRYAQNELAIENFKKPFPPRWRRSKPRARPLPRLSSGSRTPRGPARSTRSPGRRAPRGTRPRAPELNPMENIWRFMRDNWLSNRVFKSYDDIVTVCCEAWNKLIDQPETIMSSGQRKWAHGFRSMQVGISHWGLIPCVRPFSYNPFRPLCLKLFIIGLIVTCYVTSVNNTQDTGAEIWLALSLGAMARPRSRAGTTAQPAESPGS